MKGRKWYDDVSGHAILQKGRRPGSEKRDPDGVMFLSYLICLNEVTVHISYYTLRQSGCSASAYESEEAAGVSSESEPYPMVKPAKERRSPLPLSMSRAADLIIIVPALSIKLV